MLGAGGEQAMRIWARECAAAHAVTASEARALAALRTGNERGLRALPQAEDDGSAYAVFGSLACRAPLTEVLSRLGRLVCATLPVERQRLIAREVDAMLLVLDFRDRLPLAAAHRAPALRRVVFRATPRRTLEAAVVALEGDGFGVLSRYESANDAGRLKPGFVWTEGSLEEALAAVPDTHFAEAVHVVRSGLAEKD